MSIHRASDYTDEDIERAMATVARVIELYGEAYWPILDRLENELEIRRAKTARLSRHLARFDKRQPASHPKSGVSAVRIGRLTRQ